QCCGPELQRPGTVRTIIGRRVSCLRESCDRRNRRRRMRIQERREPCKRSNRTQMLLPLLASTVLFAFLLTWMVELRHRETTLPALSNRALAAPFAMMLVATLAAIPIALWPLAS